jgi:hypothetical protein
MAERVIDPNELSPGIFGQQPVGLGLPDCITPMPILARPDILLGLIELCLSFVSQKINRPSHLMTHKEHFLGPSIPQSLGVKPMHSVNYIPGHVNWIPQN